MRTFTTFASWAELLAFLKLREVVGYHAPLDISPVYVRAKAFKNGKVRVYVNSADADNFTADEDHLSRFRRPTDEEHVCCTVCGWQRFQDNDDKRCGKCGGEVRATFSSEVSS